MVETEGADCGAEKQLLQARNAECLEKDDFQGAGDLQAQLRELGARNLQPCGTVIQQLQARKAACLMHEDFLGAAAIQAQLQKIEAKPGAHLESVGPEVTKQPAESSMREAAALDAETKPMGEQLSDCGQKENLAPGTRHLRLPPPGRGASGATLGQVATAEVDRGAVTKQLQAQLARCLDQEDFAGAACVKARLTDLSAKTEGQTSTHLRGRGAGALAPGAAATVDVASSAWTQQLEGRILRVLQAQPTPQRPSHTLTKGYATPAGDSQRLKQQLAVCVEYEDFVRAAKLKAQLLQMERQRPPQTPDDGTTQRLKARLAECVRQEDFEGACALKAELKQLAAQPAQTAALLLETQRLQSSAGF